MSAILSCLRDLPASCQLDLEDRLERLHVKEKQYTVNKKAKVESSWVENTLFGDLNLANDFYIHGFDRTYDFKAIPHLVGAALLSLATLPAQLLRTIWSVICLTKAIFSGNRREACDALLENLSGITQATMMATLSVALTVFKLATFIFRDLYEYKLHLGWKNGPPRKVLLIIDEQRDFEPNGSLAVAHGNEVVTATNEFLKKIRKNPDWCVAVSQDWHPFNHKSFAAHSGYAPDSEGSLNAIEKQWFWPAHCVQGSKGAQIDPDLDLSEQEHVVTVKKGFNKHVDSFSAFQDNRNENDKGVRNDTILHERLQHWNVDEVVVVGLATDFCDKYSALDALAREYAPGKKYKVSIIKEGCRGIIDKPKSSGICEYAFEEMQDAGITVFKGVKDYFDAAKSASQSTTP